jgi:hypothetical protein
VSFLDRLAGGDRDPVRRQAESLYAALREEAQPAGVLAASKALPTGQKILRECTAEVQAAVLLIACEEILKAAERRFEHSRPYLARDVINGLLRRKITAPPHRVAAILETCASIGSAYEHWIPVRSLLALVSKPPTPSEIEALHRLQFTMEQSTYAGPRKVAQRIDEILGGDQGSLLPGGTWSARVLSDISTFGSEQRNAWCELLIHLLAT